MSDHSSPAVAEGAPEPERDVGSSRLDAVSKVVLVTGCSSGIGKSVALRLARDGHVVYATARRREAISDLVAAGCNILELDVTSEQSRRAAVEAIERRHGAVGVLVNNAGYSQSGALETLSLDQVRRQFDTNVFGLLRLVQLVLPGMRRQRFGRVVNIGSIGGRLTFPGGGAYHATKHALEALSDALRFEVAGFGIEVALVQPGLIRTEFARTAATTIAPAGDGPYDAFNASVARITGEAYVKGPLALLGGEPDSVAKVVSRALSKRRLRPRYVVTGSGRLLLMMRRILPDALWDLFMRSTYPRPA